MPQPTQTDVHVDALQTNISIAYRNTAYMADQVFPGVPVQKKSDLYFTYSKDYWFRDEAKVRAPGTNAERGGYGVSTDSYACEEYAFAKEVPDEVRENQDKPMNVNREATEFATNKILLSKEILVASRINTSGNWTNSTTLSGSSQWSDPNSNPYDDVDTARETVLLACAQEPNTMIMGYEVFNKLKNHDELIERVKHTQEVKAGLTVQQLAQALEVGKILVGKSIYTATLEPQTATYAFIWGKYCWIGYVNPSPGLLVPSAGYTFTWKNRSVRSWREDSPKQDVYEASENFDAKAVAADCGYLISAPIA